jgi:hypothetical protein
MDLPFHALLHSRKSTASLHDRASPITVLTVHRVAVRRAPRRRSRWENSTSRSASTWSRWCQVSASSRPPHSLRESSLAGFRDERRDQHFEVTGSSLVAEEETDRRVHLGSELGAQTPHDHGGDSESVDVLASLGQEDRPHGGHDLAPGVSFGRVGPAFLNGHVLENVAHCDQVRGEGIQKEVSGTV